MATTGAGVPFRVALTFDAEHPDRPTDPGAELRLLDSLRRLAARSTYFLQGRWVEAFPERARAIRDDGHLIGSHGHYHVRMPLLSAAGLARDIRDAEAAIVAATGVDPRPWFRCPFGAGADSSRVLGKVRAAGYAHVHWDVLAEDWDPAIGGDEVARRVVDGVLERGGGDSIVLLHSWPRSTAAAIDAIVGRLRDAGAALVTVAALAPAP